MTPSAIGNPIAEELMRKHAELSPPAQAAIGMSRVPGIAETNLTPQLPPNAPEVQPATAQEPAAAMTTLPAPNKVKGLGPLPGSPQAENREELARVQASRPGYMDINIPGRTGKVLNPVLKGLAGIGDVLGTAFFPGAAAAIPGTTLHHKMLVNQLRGNEAEYQGQQAAEDQQQLREAQEEEAAARTGKLTAETAQIGQPKPPSNLLELFLQGNPQGTAEQFMGMQEAHRPLTNDFELWAKQNPGKPVSDFLKLKQENAIPREGETPLGERVDQLNAMMAKRYQLAHPGQQLPQEYTLPPNATQKDFDRIDKGLEAEERAGTGMQNHQEQMALRQAMMAMAASTRNESALDRETARYAKPHEKAISDASAQLEKINEAKAMINGPAASQALGIPKVLTALVSGQGSGVRITQAELNSIAKARGITGDVEGFINRVSGKGALTAEQQRQLTGILDDVGARVRQKQAIANEALDNINGAGSREEILRHEKEARQKMTEMEAGPQPVKVQQKGSEFRYSTDGGKTWNPGKPPNQ